MQATLSATKTIATLHAGRPGQARAVYELQEGQCLAVGSDPGVDICLIDDEIASTHCVISARGGCVTVRDCFSATGTFLDKAKVRESRLTNDAEIRVGRCSILVKLSCPASPSPGGSNLIPAAAIPAPERGADSSALVVPKSENVPADDLDTACTVRKINDLELQLQQAHAEIEVLQSRLTTSSHVVAPSVDPYDEEMLQLLRAEILELQAALADRDQSTAEPRLEHHSDCGGEEMLSKPDAEKLVERLEQLLQELQQRDDQISTLTELLEAAEAANRAELDERSQIDAWLRDIEQRCSDREHAWRLEQNKLQSELASIAAERDRAEAALNTDSSSVKLEATQNVMASLRDTAETQRQKLQEADQTISQLRRELETVKRDQPREERMQLAEERSEIARLRQELEIERQRKQDPAANDNNLKFQALRQHLNEIHEQEQKEREERRLSSRIARLWHRIEGK